MRVPRLSRAMFADGNHCKDAWMTSVIGKCLRSLSIRQAKLKSGGTRSRTGSCALPESRMRRAASAITRVAWRRNPHGLMGTGRLMSHPGRRHRGAGPLSALRLQVVPQHSGITELLVCTRCACATSIPTPVSRASVRSLGAGCWMNGLRTIACLLAKSMARHPRFTSLTEFRSRKEPRSVSKEHQTAVRLRRSITLKSGNYLPWHLPPGQRLFSSHTYSYKPAASHSGFAAMENSCDHAAVKVLGSSIVRMYESVFGFFQEIRSMVLSASLCMRYSLGLV